VFGAPKGGDPLGISWCLVWKKTRMIGLPGSENLMIRSAVLTQYRSVTDRQTDKCTSFNNIVHTMHMHRTVKMINTECS